MQPKNKRVTARSTGQASAHGVAAFSNTGIINGPINIAVPRIPISGYLLQVEAISAADFRDREEELGDLFRFCSDERVPEQAKDAYWRWLAPAWAGKSALMAQFVLHPPQGIDVVSFFVTSRLARQNEAASFCEVVQRQLYSLLGEEEPLTTPYTRDEQLRLALTRAALNCAERNRRLVLVVDGLDEDRGVTSGSDSHSIAALLPRVPPHGMRIIVAGRPHPPIPDDVPLDHPLRDPGINHWLEPSPYAQAVRLDAERDLIRLLESGGFGRDLIGFIAAAGGGLSADDLATLTKSRPRLVERELSAVSGRSFQQRSAHWSPTGPHIYLLAHEEIQQSAVQLITPGEMTHYRSCLHQWADTYREDGWPTSTPEYLLRGYMQLLREAKDTRRLATFACDSERNERIWVVTGADLEALGEIGTTFDQLLLDANEEGDQNVADALRLAVTRDKLHDRMGNLPPSLIALWAQLGDIDRAISLAKSQMESYKEVLAVVAIVKEIATSVPIDDLFSLVGAIRDPADQDKCFEAISGRLAEHGRHDEALHVSREIRDHQRKASSQAAIAEEMAKTGLHDQALTVANAVLENIAEIHDSSDKSGVLARISLTFASIGDSDHASELVEQAVRVADSANESYERARDIAILARRLAYTPLDSRAVTLARRAANSAVTVDDPDEHSWLFRIVAAALASTGQYEDAMEFSHRHLPNQFDLDEALAEIGIALTERMELEKALDLVGGIEEPIDRVKVLNAAIEALVKSNQVSRAMAVAQDALMTIATIHDEGWKVNLMVEVGRELYRAGRTDQAYDLAQSATNLARDRLVPHDKVETLTRVAGALFKVGRREEAFEVAGRAREVAEANSYTYGRIIALTKVASCLNQLECPEESSALFSQLFDTAKHRLDSATQAEAILRIVEGLCEAGNISDASDYIREIIKLSEEAATPSRARWDMHAAAYAFVAVGRFSDARKIISILPQDMVPEFLSYLVRGMSLGGQLDEAMQIIQEIEMPRERERALGYVAGGAALAGNFNQAMGLVNEIRSPAMRDLALPRVIRGMVRAGELSQACELVHSISSPESKSEALGVIANFYGSTKQGRIALAEALSLGPWKVLVSDICSVAPGLLGIIAEDVLLRS